MNLKIEYFLMLEGVYILKNHNVSDIKFEYLLILVDLRSLT
jgi:hypothetical protein